MAGRNKVTGQVRVCDSFMRMNWSSWVDVGLPETVVGNPAMQGTKKGFSGLWLKSPIMFRITFSS